MRPHIPLRKGHRPRGGRFDYSETHLSAHASGKTTPKHVSLPKGPGIDRTPCPRCLARRSFTPGDRHRRRPPVSEAATKRSRLRRTRPLQAPSNGGIPYRFLVQRCHGNHRRHPASDLLPGGTVCFTDGRVPMGAPRTWNSPHRRTRSMSCCLE